MPLSTNWLLTPSSKFRASSSRVHASTVLLVTLLPIHRFGLRNSALALFLILASSRLGKCEEPLQFNRDIRPILAENCFYCHGQDGNKREGDLRLDVRESAIQSGAFVPGNEKDSALVQRIHSSDGDQIMPPPKSNRRLSDEQKAILDRWIREGASYSIHWAFEAPKKSNLPEVKNTPWVKNPIDQFVLSRLESANVAPSPPANKLTLIKRLYADLVGLPPSPEAIAAFLADTTPEAYEKVVDDLMKSPHYGERMALSWLDAARYADSNGFQQDGDTWQWIWRDWVVKAMNEDLPFDQFTVWQLAGDLLPNATNEQKVASGFNRNHMLNGEGGAIAEEQRWVNLFDRVDTTCTTWLGMTMACAQCHDHKYDPMTLKDYYGMLDAFNRLPETGTPQRFSVRIRVGAPFIELPTEENKAKVSELEAKIAEADKETPALAEAAYQGWRLAVSSDTKASDGKGLANPTLEILKKPVGERSEEEKKQLETQLRKFFEDKIRSTVAKQIPSWEKVEKLRKELADYKADQIPKVMIMSDEKPRETSILDRGEYLKPLEKVSFRTPAFLPPLPEGAPSNRLGLAQWLVAPENPLTARVQVNRIWQHFFGVGIVKTSEDFGVQSDYPIHGPLLDWLAVHYRENGWSTKKLQRMIVTSNTYQQSSQVTSQHKIADPENRLYARASRFRLPSMLLRDWALASSGLLDRKLGGKPVYPYQPDDVWEALAITKERDFTYPLSKGSDLYRRSLYTFWRRTVGPANMFDASNRQTCRVRTVATSTPLHALTTLNDPTWIEAARVLAERSIQSSPMIDDQIAFAFERVLCRKPTANELQKLKHAHEKQYQYFEKGAEEAKSFVGVGEYKRDESISLVELASLSHLCLGILNLDEALTRE